MSDGFLSRIAPPPRRVSLGLRCALMGNFGVLIGGMILAPALFFTILFLSEGSVLGDLRLWLSAQEAHGTLLGMEPTNFTQGAGDSTRNMGRSDPWIDNVHRIYRLNYSFELPDGGQHKGSSYVKGRRAAQRIEHVANAQGHVPVEYIPSSPSVSRLRGTRTSPYGPGVLLVLIGPAIGTAVLAAGLITARRNIRLLRDGEAALATVTHCRVAPEASGSNLPNTPKSKWMPFDEFSAYMQRKVADEIEKGTAVETRSFSFLGFESVKTETISGSEFKSRFSSFLKLFRSMMFFLWGFWTLVMTFILWVIWSSPEAIVQKLLFTGVALLFACFLGGFAWLMFRHVQLATGIVRGETALESLDLEVDCRTEFTTREGRKIKTQDRVLFDRELLGEEPYEPVLYDPSKPKRAVLLDGLPARVGPGGALQASRAGWRILRLTGVCLILLVAVIAGLYAV